MTTTHVKVALRIRPLSEKEQLCNCTECISVIPNEPQVLIGNDHSFTFDHVFDTRSRQADIYHTCVVPLVDKFTDGFNATLLAYGQTGSGKTFSMGTAVDSNIDSEHRGVIPRFVDDLFSRLTKKKNAVENYDYEVSVSFLELYNEDLVDLLNDHHFSHQRKRSLSDGNIGDISIREDVYGNIYWSNVCEEPCANAHELIGHLAKGSLCRTTAKTDMNDVSSRSHAIFSVILKQWIPDDTQGGQLTKERKTIVSKFHFVDLAGSERLKRTNAQGDRAREGIAINSGLLALGNVISALGDETRRPAHVPYRVSKLTRLLQDSLGGNSQTLMLACVSAADANFTETLSTLKYANRARNIKNRVSINQEFANTSVETQQLRALVHKLKMEINTLRFQNCGAPASLVSSVEAQGLRQEVNSLRDRVQKVSEELCLVSAERDTLLIERDVGQMASQHRPDLIQQLMQTPQSANSNMPRSLPMVAYYQTTIKDLRNELADTRERLAFVESTQAPMMQALRMATDVTPVPSFTTRTRKNRRHRSHRTYIVNSRASSLTSRRSMQSSKVPHVGSTRRSSEHRRRSLHGNVPLRPPLPVATTDTQDVDQWLKEIVGAASEMRGKVHDSVEKINTEITRSLDKLKSILPHTPSSIQSEAADDIMADDELIEVLQASENQDIFTELEHEMIVHGENTSPSKESSTDHSDASDIMLDSATDSNDSGESVLCRTNPQLGHAIRQVHDVLRAKQGLVSLLEKSKTEYMLMRQAYEQKIHILSQEILTIKRERDKALQRSSYKGIGIGEPPSQRAKQQMSDIRMAYEIKMKGLLGQLVDLRRKYSQTTRDIQATRRQNESMLNALRRDVACLKAEKKRMIKRMKEEAERVKSQTLEHMRVIQQLKRKEVRISDAKRRLEREKNNTQRLLQKRTDEITLTNERLKQLMNILRRAVREGGQLDQRLMAKCAGLLNMGGIKTSRYTSKRHPSKTAIPVEIRVAFKKKLLDRALYQYIGGKQALDEMQKLVAKRDQLALKKYRLQSELHNEQLESLAKQFMNERLEAVVAEISYTNARIHVLQNDAVHELMQDDTEEEIAIDDSHRSRPAKHVTFADEVTGYRPNTDPASDWQDMDALEERYSLAPNADPDTCYDMIQRLIGSLASDEAHKIMVLLIKDITALHMNEYESVAYTQQLQKTILDLRRTLVVMKNKAIETATKSEKKIGRLEQHSQRSSMSSLEDVQDNDSAIDMRIEEHYTTFDKIYEDGIRGTIRSPVYSSCATSPASQEARRATAKPKRGHSPTLKPQPPRPPQKLVECAPLVSTQDWLASPEQFLMHSVELMMPKPPPSPGLPTADFARYQSDLESSTSTICSQHLRRTSFLSDVSSSSFGSNQTGTHTSPGSPIGKGLPASRPRAHSKQQQDKSTVHCRLSSRGVDSPLQRQTPMSGNVFDRLANCHTHASQAKRSVHAH